MSKPHTYEVALCWTGNRGSGTSSYRDYDRTNSIDARGRPTILGSSDPVFRGDASRWNPEQLLVAALSQCHMLWYLHLAAVSGVVVTAYADTPTGTLTESDDGAGSFDAVLLRPAVEVTSASMVAVAVSLHQRAASMCFIARSVNFPVDHDPVVRVQGSD